MAVRGLLFDFDNTLVSTTYSDNLAIETVRNSLLETLSEQEALKIDSIDPRGEINPHEWRTDLWQKSLDILSKCTMGISARDVYALWRFTRVERLVLNQEIQTMLINFHKRYKMAIVTNSDPIIQREKLQSCGVDKHFDAIIISGEQPQPKPHPSIFHTACAALGVMPRDCVMVGDNLEHDILGGRNAMVRATVWVRGERNAERKLTEDIRPDYIITSVLELPSILERIKTL